MRMSRDELAERIARHVAEDRSVEAAPGLFLYRFSSPTGPRYGVTEPSFCVIAQGSKEVLLGKERYRYDASHYLLVSAELPVAGHIVDASKEQPYLAVRLVLDPAVVTEVLIEAGLHTSGMDDALKVMAVSRLDASLLDAVVRVVRLLDSPGDYGVLAPLVAREIIYRLCLGEQGGRLRQIAVSGGRAHRIAKAIELLRTNHNKPLRIAGLARQLGMSVSGLHHHFKAATGMSPLAALKWWRSEEHTSELQSRSDLVCRLLLEKKKPERRNLHPPEANSPSGPPRVASRTVPHPRRQPAHRVPRPIALDTEQLPERCPLHATGLP